MTVQDDTAIGGGTGTREADRIREAQPWLDPRPPGYNAMAPAELAHLVRLDDLPGALAVIFDFALIAVTIFLAERYFHWWSYVLAVIIVGSRQQAMLIMMHEASHEGLFNNKKVNDLVGETLLAWPLFISMRSFRDNHIAHHRYLNTWDDPDWIRYKSKDSPERGAWSYPRPPRTVVVALVMDLLGLNVVDQIRRGARLGKPRDHRTAEEKRREVDNPVKLPRSWTRARWALRILAAVTFTATGTWLGFFMYWLVPIFTMLKMCNRLRQLSGHFAIYGGEGLRTTISGRIERFLLGPHNIGYHTEHHVYPMVPWHNLEKLHHVLVARGDFGAGTPFRLTHGYVDVVRDWGRDESGQRRTAVLPRPTPTAPPPPYMSTSETR